MGTIYAGEKKLLASRKTESDEVTYSSEEESERKKQKYKTYHSSLEDTIFLNDTEKDAIVPFPLFVFLCIQAAEATGKKKLAFSRLIKKIKTGTIKIPHKKSDFVHQKKPVHVFMTHRDMYHHLLVCIPMVEQKCYINGIHTKLVVYKGETKQDKIYNDQIIANLDRSQTKTYKDLFFTSQHRLDALDYDFTTDVLSHQIVAKFEKIIKFKKSFVPRTRFLEPQEARLPYTCLTNPRGVTMIQWYGTPNSIVLPKEALIKKGNHKGKLKPGWKITVETDDIIT